MLPRNTIDDRVDARLPDAVVAANCALVVLTGLVAAAYFAHDLVGKNRVTAALAVGVSHFYDRVSAVFTVGGYEQVGRVDARRVVARVADGYASVDTDSAHCQGHAVSLQDSTLDVLSGAEFSVSLSVGGASPAPAIATAVDLVPKARDLFVEVEHATSIHSASGLVVNQLNWTGGSDFLLAGATETFTQAES